MANYEQQSDGFTYDVFLSFRGEDTREKVVGYLREEFRKKGINTFYDDESLKIGEELSPAFSKAIEESNISVIVLSENYASSKWCLNELTNIMECTKRNNKQITYPIFYHVDPSDVRNQRNSYGKAMDDHKKKYGKDSEKVKAWTKALFDVANLKGHHYHIHKGTEIDHVKNIAEKVHAKIAPKPLLVGEKPVGLDQRIEEVKSLLDLKPNNNTVCMLGITGPGGIGKSELAKALYDKIVHQFEAKSFLTNVREKSNKINGLEDLQETLLSEMFERPETKLGSTSKGINEIKHKLGRKKVLLVVDNVDELKQLETLAGGSDWFGPGSRIIITTRDKGLLMGTHPIEVKTYEMTELKYQLSLELFCRHAFGKSHPKTGYEAMSCRAVGYAKGLPLALKVIGSNLRTRKSLKTWEDALKGYERIPHSEIQDVLNVSYEALEPDAQSVFLDIACFFKGKSVEYVEEILEEFSAASNIEELQNKSLLNVSNGYLHMHDLIEDMGKEIVRQEAPNNPAKRSRLWFHQDVIEVLSAKDSGSEANAIQGIMLRPPNKFSQREYLNGNAFEKMNHLRILIVQNMFIFPQPKHLSNHLRLLDWAKYREFSPKEFNALKIVRLSLFGSSFIKAEPFKQFSNLTVMNFSYIKYMETMPDVSEVENLRELNLGSCPSLTTVHESVGFLKHLVHLSARGCFKLRIFLQRMFLPSLEVLDLELCECLEHFPDIVDKMNKPLKISITHTCIETLPDSFGNLIGLVSLDMKHNKKLKSLPSSLFRLPNVVTFKFGYCYRLGKFFRAFLSNNLSEASEHSPLKILKFNHANLSHEDIQAILICFPKLEELNVSSNKVVSLPACIKESNHLKYLAVRCCKKLKEIPECTNLRHLDVNDCTSLTHISELPCTIQKIYASKCFKISSETSDMIWDQMKKERHGLEIGMPEIKVPKWFDYRCNGGIPRLWVRGKFPINFALALLFQFKDRLILNVDARVELHLVINGQRVLRKDYYNFEIPLNHVLVCDLRLLFNEEEWLNIDALLLEHEWNQVQISYGIKDSTLVEDFTLREWGVFVYKQGTVHWEEHVQFTCPTIEDSNDAAVNQNRDDETIGIEDISSPIDPEEVDETQDTPYTSGFFMRFLYTCFCKCFS